MEADLDREEALQPQPRELSGESLLTSEYLGVGGPRTSCQKPDTAAPLSSPRSWGLLGIDESGAGELPGAIRAVWLARVTVVIVMLAVAVIGWSDKGR